MLVSVIIPTYNRGDIIEKTIRNVLDQTYKNIEIIIIDDGSNDNTQNIVNEIIATASLPIAYYYKNNGGVSSARNLGIQLSKGEFISFLDSDDIIFPSKIEKQIAKIGRYDGCYCGYQISNELNEVIRKPMISYKKGNILLSYLRNETAPSINDWIFNKQIIEHNHLRFREGCSYGEDVEFISKVLFYANVIYVNEILSCYVKNNERTSLSEFHWGNIKRDIFIWNEIWQWLEARVLDINLKKSLFKVIFHYRIPAVVLYKINAGLSDKLNAKKVFNENEETFNCLDFSNGLRSIKLWLYYIKIKVFLWIGSKIDG